MATTTIRIDKSTHQELIDLSAASGDSLIETVRAAAEALRRQRFADQVVAELDELRQDRQRWESYLAEAESTVTPDGLGR